MSDDKLATAEVARLLNRIDERDREIDDLRDEVLRLRASNAEYAREIARCIEVEQRRVAAERERCAQLVVNCYGMSVEDIAAAIRKGEP